MHLTCQEVVEVVTELLSGGLEPEERIVLEQHLLVCPPCTAHVAQMKATIALTASLRAEPATAPPAALEAFRRWKQK